MRPARIVVGEGPKGPGPAARTTGVTECRRHSVRSLPDVTLRRSGSRPTARRGIDVALWFGTMDVRLEVAVTWLVLAVVVFFAGRWLLTRYSLWWFRKNVSPRIGPDGVLEAAKVTGLPQEARSALRTFMS